MPQFLTSTQVARALDTSESEARRALDSFDESIRVGRYRCIDAEALPRLREAVHVRRVSAPTIAGAGQ